MAALSRQEARADRDAILTIMVLRVHRSKAAPVELAHPPEVLNLQAARRAAAMEVSYKKVVVAAAADTLVAAAVKPRHRLTPCRKVPAAAAAAQAGFRLQVRRHRRQAVLVRHRPILAIAVISAMRASEVRLPR